MKRTPAEQKAVEMQIERELYAELGPTREALQRALAQLQKARLNPILRAKTLEGIGAAEKGIQAAQEFLYTEWLLEVPK